MNDGRQLVGQMLAFDKVRYTRGAREATEPFADVCASQYMNLVLSDCEEFRKVKRKSKSTGAPGQAGSGAMVETEEKRMLGLAIVRGANVVSCSVDGPPPSDPAARLGAGAQAGGPPAAMQAGQGIARPAGRGAGLQGPAAGVGGPGFPGAPPAGFPGRGGPPPGFPPGGGFPGGPPPGFQPPPGGRGFPPPGFPGR